MPLIESSSYNAPWYFLGPHGESILPNVTRRRIRAPYGRRRLELPDGDFLDVDWVKTGEAESDQCVVVIHGLEGDSRAPYVKSAARTFAAAGYAVAAINLRGCSGEPNRLPRSYHSGSSDDLAAVLHDLAGKFGYIYLVGFSLGGNIVLKYLGEVGNAADPVVAAAVFSVPVDLEGASRELDKGSNRFYMRRFMRLLGRKIEQKAKMYPDIVDGSSWRPMKSFREFDEKYTAPLNGFAGALDYWHRCSSRPGLPAIRVPSLLINASNDPFLSESCYPFEEATESRHLFLETPDQGGHCGFPGRRRQRGYWHEERALDFFSRASGRVGEIDGGGLA